MPFNLDIVHEISKVYILSFHGIEQYVILNANWWCTLSLFWSGYQDICIARLNTRLCIDFQVYEIEYIIHFICAALKIINEEKLWYLESQTSLILFQNYDSVKYESCKSQSCWLRRDLVLNRLIIFR